MIIIEPKKMGRPTDNPKGKLIATRIDNETHQILSDFCKQEDIDQSEGVRRGIRRLKPLIGHKNDSYHSAK